MRSPEAINPQVPPGYRGRSRPLANPCPMLHNHIHIGKGEGSALTEQPDREGMLRSIIDQLRQYADLVEKETDQPSAVHFYQAHSGHLVQEAFDLGAMTHSDYSGLRASAKWITRPSSQGSYVHLYLIVVCWLYRSHQAGELAYPLDGLQHCSDEHQTLLLAQNVAAFNRAIAGLIASELDVEQRRRPRKRGRKTKYDPKFDSRVLSAWETQRYRTYKSLGSAFGLPGKAVRSAIERARKRRKK